MSWLKRLFGSAVVTKEPAPIAHGERLPTIEEMNRIIPAMGALMEKHAGFGIAVFDEGLLPASKGRVEFVLFCAIGITKDEQQARMLSAAMLHLADYQPTVGPKPIAQLPALPDPGSMTSPEAIKAAAEAILSHSNTSAYALFEGRIQQELARLRSLADKALAERAKRIGKQPKQ